MNDDNCTQNTINPSELNLWRIIKKNDDGTVDAVSEYVSSTGIYFYGQTGYLNYVKALNTIAAQYTNDKYVQSTRHMGYSNQTETIKDASKLSQTTPPWTKITSSNDGTWLNCDSSTYLCGTDEVLGAGNIGYEQDYNLVNAVYGNMVGYTSEGVSMSYWIASRIYNHNESGGLYYNGRRVSEEGGLTAKHIYRYTSRFADASPQYAIRPILILKSDINIISGDGKSRDTAYILG